MNIEFIIGLITVAISAIGGISAFLYRRRVDDVARKRLTCAEALSTLLDWLEMPYRIRRRPAGNDETRSKLTESMHNLQARINFYRAWLQVESPQVAHKYEALHQAVKTVAAPAIQQAWEQSGISQDAEMNIGSLGKFDIEKPQDDFLKAVRDEIKVWRISRRR